MVKQLSVFIENTKGRLANLTRVLGNAGVDLHSLSIADTANFGILRAIVDDNEKALKVLRAQGYTVNITELIAVSVQDHPGGLAHALETLDGVGVSIEYLYSFVRRPSQSALILLKVDDAAKAVAALEKQGISLLKQEELL
jgi:hypothetical protein